MNKEYTRKIFLLTMTFFCAMGDAFAVDGKLKGWGTTIETALNTAVGIFAIVGGFIVFIQYMQGNDSAQKNFIKFVIGLAIFGLSALIAGTFV